MEKVKINKTIYTIIDRKEDEISICYRIKKGNTIKSLIQSKKRGSWDLWSGRNGINEIGLPKRCEPQFLTEEEAAQLPKRKKRASTSKSTEIKKALKQAFPNIKFSVTRLNSSYYVNWENGIREGATLEQVKLIADKWDSCRNISDDPYEPSYVGNSVFYRHEITDKNWREFVIEKVSINYNNGNIYNPKLDRFTPKDSCNWNIARNENQTYYDWLHNGIKCDLDGDRSRIDKELYYEFHAPKKEKESTAVDLDSYQQQKIENKDQFIPLAINYNTRKVKAKFTTCGFKDNIDEYLELCSSPQCTSHASHEANWNLEECIVQEEIILESEDYDFFTQNLLKHYEFLANKGGFFSTAPELKQIDDDYLNWTEEQLEIFDATKQRKCVSVSAKDRKEILVDPQSIYGSVSYIGLIEPESQDLRQQQALGNLVQKLLDFMTHNQVVCCKNDDAELLLKDAQENQFTLDEVIKAFGDSLSKIMEQAEPESTEEPKSNAVDSSPEIEQEKEKQLNWYEKKQQDRKERYLAKAAKAQKESNTYYQSSQAETKHIPPGQPVLVNHHSEKAHRRALQKSWEKLGKSVKAQKKSEYYLGKAAGVGNAGISSDDPDAIAKLQEQLEEAIALQEKMKTANKLIGKGDKAGLAAMGYSQREILGLFTPDFCNRIGYADYQLKNNNANIRRIKARIKELEETCDRETEEFVFEGATVVHNVEENRVQLFFDSIPNKEFRQLLKSHGFRWSRTNQAWQRHLNDSGIFEAKWIKDKFLELE